MSGVVGHTFNKVQNYRNQLGLTVCY